MSRLVVVYHSSLKEGPQHDGTVFLMVEEGCDDLVEVSREDQIPVVVVQTPEHDADEHAERQDHDVEGLIPDWFPFLQQGRVDEEATTQVVGYLEHGVPVCQELPPTWRNRAG